MPLSAPTLNMTQEDVYMAQSKSRNRMKQVIVNQAMENLENSYPEGGVSEEVIEEVVLQVIEELYDYGEMDEEDYKYFTRNVSRIKDLVLKSLPDESEIGDSVFGLRDEEE